MASLSLRAACAALFARLFLVVLCASGCCLSVALAFTALRSQRATSILLDIWTHGGITVSLLRDPDVFLLALAGGLGALCLAGLAAAAAAVKRLLTLFCFGCLAAMMALAIATTLVERFRDDANNLAALYWSQFENTLSLSTSFSKQNESDRDAIAVLRGYMARAETLLALLAVLVVLMALLAAFIIGFRGQTIDVGKVVATSINLPASALLLPAESVVLKNSSLSKTMSDIVTQVRAELGTEDKGVSPAVDEDGTEFVLRIKRDRSSAHDTQNQETFRLEIGGIDSDVVSQLCHPGGEDFAFSEENVIRRLHLQEALQEEFAIRGDVNASLVDIGKIKQSKLKRPLMNKQLVNILLMSSLATFGMSGLGYVAVVSGKGLALAVHSSLAGLSTVLMWVILGTIGQREETLEKFLSAHGIFDLNYAGEFVRNWFGLFVSVIAAALFTGCLSTWASFSLFLSRRSKQAVDAEDSSENSQFESNADSSDLDYHPQHSQAFSGLQLGRSAPGLSHRQVAALPLATLVGDAPHASPGVSQQRLVTVDINDLVQHLAAVERKKVKSSKRKRRGGTSARVDSGDSSSNDSES